jgi:hypothetical protein
MFFDADDAKCVTRLPHLLLRVPTIQNDDTSMVRPIVVISSTTTTTTTSPRTCLKKSHLNYKLDYMTRVSVIIKEVTAWTTVKLGYN